MAAAASPPAPSPSQSSESEVYGAPRTINLRNPAPLSAAQEGQVRDIYHKKVRDQCAAEIKTFAACAINRTITATWICRDQRLAMNSCMLKASQDKKLLDRAREEWFAGREERRAKRISEEQAVEKRRQEIIEMMEVDRRRREEAEERARIEKDRRRGN